jgi:hypothetical protein
MLQRPLPQQQPSQQLLAPQACWTRFLSGLISLLLKRKYQVGASY